MGKGYNYGTRPPREEIFEQFRQFSEKFNQGECVFCNSELSYFDINTVCLHWLLNPPGFKKKDFHLIYEAFPYFKIEAYLRWIANQERMAGNINDLTVEKDQDKVIQVSMKYKNFEWMIFCSRSDFEGHNGDGNPIAQKPHYHFQMKINNLPFIKYTDYHIPLHESDIKGLKMKSMPNAVFDWGPGAGMEEIFKQSPGEIIKHSKNTTDESKATLNITTWIDFGEKGMRGEEIEKAIARSRETGDSITKSLELARIRSASKQQLITPHESVPQIPKRDRKGKRKLQI